MFGKEKEQKEKINMIKVAARVELKLNASGSFVLSFYSGKGSEFENYSFLLNRSIAIKLKEKIAEYAN